MTVAVAIAMPVAARLAVVAGVGEVSMTLVRAVCAIVITAVIFPDVPLKAPALFS